MRTQQSFRSRSHVRYSISLGYLEVKHGLRDLLSEDLKAAQQPAMQHVWENPEDEVWNDL